MNILFLTMSKMLNVKEKGIYTDLMRKFRLEGHKVYIVSPTERRDGYNTRIIEEEGARILSVRTLNVQKTNVIEKGIGQLSIEILYKRAIKKHFKNIEFDLILYSTPPITFPKVIEYVKKVNPSAKTYLLLKDIFPQNAVDMGMLSKTGLKGLLYKFFRAKEKKLYALSDYIGCMSPANVRYVLEHNPEISEDRVEVAPNSLEMVEGEKIVDKNVLVKYGLPTDRPIFIYGGNLGVPQGIPFLIQCLEANADREDCHFVVVGSGTYYQKLADWCQTRQPKAVTVMRGLPKEDYDKLVKACHVGLIFLDYRFTIPNFPSRLLSYLENRMPVISCTDLSCDTGYIAEVNGFGYYTPSNDVIAFTNAVDRMLASDMMLMGEKGYRFCLDNYSIANTYDAIVSKIQ
ncbi:MAG: glycosyltransferase family 4 protein [Bacteroidales bacterium]|nr:glycosyltransferase family 4 protein [Bacteroidales bacterium]